MSVRYTFMAVVVCVALLVTPRAEGASVPSTPARDTSEARLLFVGDIMLGRYVGSSMSVYGNDLPFAGVKDFLSSADLTIGNLEGPLVPTNRFSIPRPYPNLLNLTGSDRSAPSLARAGFDLLSLANNHSYDSRFEGLKATINALQGAGIAPFGVDSPTGQTAVVREVHGLKIAFLAYTSILNIWLAPVAGMPFISFVNPNVPGDRERLSGEVARAKQNADLVVLVMHWGAEYTLQPVAGQKLLAQTAAAAGADLVVGAHPHVAQGMEQIRTGNKQTLVAYSLGNALFDQVARLETRQGLALECVVDRDGVKRARLIPLETRSNRQGFNMNVVDDASGQTALNRAAASTPADL